jgi:hypothetical protein
VYLLPGVVRNFKPTHYSFHWTRLLALSNVLSVSLCTVMKKYLLSTLIAVIAYCSLLLVDSEDMYSTSCQLTAHCIGLCISFLMKKWKLPRIFVTRGTHFSFH